MFKERTPLWIVGGGFTLTAMAGCINAVGFLGYHHQPISHLTGTLTQFGTDLVRGESELAQRTGLLLLSFFLGAVASAAILRNTGLKMGRRYGAVLLIQSIVLALSYRLLSRGHMAGEWLAAGACGLQNAMATSYSGAVIRSTHMTGIITDLGISLGHWLRGQRVDGFRLRLYLLLLGGFTFGSILGTFGFIHLGYRVLLGPALLSGFAGAAYSAYKQWQRFKRPRTDDASPAT